MSLEMNETTLLYVLCFAYGYLGCFHVVAIVSRAATNMNELVNP